MGWGGRFNGLGQAFGPVVTPMQSHYQARITHLTDSSSSFVVVRVLKFTF